MTIRLPLLILVRHAQPTSAVEGRLGGWDSSPLTAVGRRQAELTARRLQRALDGHPAMLVSSDLPRALQTGQPLAQRRGEPLRDFAELRDPNSGQANGLPHEQAQRLRQPRGGEWVDWQPYPDAETWNQFTARVSAFLDGWLLAQPHITVVFCHYATIWVLCARWLGLPNAQDVLFRTDWASITVLSMGKHGERALLRLNDTAHLHGGHGASLL